MAVLNSDQDGFLVGSMPESLEKIASEVEILKAIQEDTSATLDKLSDIANLLSTQPVDVHAPVSTPPANGRSPESPPDRLPAQNLPLPAPPAAPSAAPATVSLPVAGSAPTVAPAVNPPAPTVVVVTPPAPSAANPARVPAPSAEPRTRRAPATPPERERDESGRWRRREPGSPGGAPDSAPGESDGRESHAMEDAAETLKGVASAVASSSDGIDPSVQALKEVGGAFAPVIGILKPMGRLFGLGRRPEQKNQRENVAWYRRIWGAVKGDRKGNAGMGLIMTALLSMLGMLLAPIKALSKLVGLTSLLKGAGGLLGGLRGGRAGGRSGRGGPGGRGTRAGPEGGRRPPDAGRRGRNNAPGAPDAGRGPRGPAPSRTGGMIKGALRKLPWIGAMVGAGMLASDVMASDDPDLTPQENKTQRYGNIGSGVGGLVGGVVGMLGGPAGAIAGAMIGDQLGAMVGTWLSTIDLASIPGKISEAFTSLKDSALQSATSAFESIQEAWGGMVATGTKYLAGMADSVKDSFGKAVDSLLGIKDAVVSKVQTATDYVTDKVSSAKDYVVDTATSIKDAGQNLINKATGGIYTGGSNARKDELIRAMDAGGITDPKSKAMLMANVDHETMGFKKNEENLNYSAKRLQEVFPKYYKTPEAARADARNPEAIANRVYGGRMGNKDPGDGYKYRGRGDIQLTGRDQYAAMGRKLGIDLENNPDLAKDPKIAARIAVAHWKSSGADRAAMAGDQVRARKLTNGGTNGLEDVQGKYGGYLAQAQAGDLTPVRRADQVKVQAPEAANTAMASTMTAMKGSATVGVVPIGPRSSVAPALPGSQPVGVMAAPVPVPRGMASIKPISAGTISAPSYKAPAPDATSTKIPPTPAVEQPLMAPSKSAPTPAMRLMLPLTQDVSDRNIAHASSGGIGL